MTRLLTRRPAGGANSGNIHDVNNNTLPSPQGRGARARANRNNGGSNQNASSGGSLCSRQSFMILAIGILTGYVVVPLMVLEVRFEDLFALDATATTLKKQKEKRKQNLVASTNLIKKNKQQQSYRGEQEEMLESLIRRGDNSHADVEMLMNNNGIVSSRSLIPEADGAAMEGIYNSHDLVQHLLKSIQERDANNADGVRGGSLKIIGEYSDTEKRIMEDRDVLSHQSVPTSTTPYIMKTHQLPDHQRKKILITGGAGFVGSHLVDKLMMEGHEVIVLDNFFTGQKKNIAHWLHHPNFSLVVHDVIEPIKLEVDQIYHLACPASPPHYQYNPVKTIKTSTMGTLNMLGLAKRVKARMLLTSTSEIYGDPLEHPQKESYWGNVNTIGPRSCYDEGKRVAETMMYSYKNQNEVDIRIARIFNTFGPRMHPNDGRVVSNFIIQALQDKDITIYGDGKQTRSFQYVYDLVEGLYKLMNGDYDHPVNLGNPQEYSVTEFAEYVQQMTHSDSKIEYLPKSQDDPSQRRPDISTAKRELDWEPRVTVEQGLKLTIEYFQSVLNAAGEIIPTGPGAAKPEA